MYDIRQFKPALFALLLLGVSGFALAAQWPGLWVLATGGILLNAWLVKTGRFTPMPRFLASIVTLVAFLYIIDLVMNSPTTPILVIGQFLVLLQLVKLYEHRANRDFAQLIILSLLLMVAAAINTASFLFGLMFIAYLFLSLYVCLLFHLKVESEEARRAVTLPNIEPNPNTLRQDQRFLSSSMRRLTGLISGVSVAAAVVVFLFFPRGTGANLLGPQLPISRPMTGFSEHVGFQEVAKITQSNDKVADVTIYRDGKLFTGTAPIYLRGLTLNHYTGPGSQQSWNERRNRPPYEWLRSLPAGVEAHDDNDLQGGDTPTTGPIWKQVIHLQPLGSSVLFAMAGPVRVTLMRHSGFNYSKYDDYLQAKEITGPTDYEVISTGKMPYRPLVSSEGMFQERARRSVIDPKIEAYGARPEVSGVDANNVPLVELRDAYLKKNGFDVADWHAKLAQHDRFDRFDPPVYARLTPYDEPIARNIERHLRTTFSYTLDLTDAKRIEGQDPMVAFLYDLKRGHCEYFAGAMTLMLQSLYIPARVVIGFRCDDYNTLAEWYHVEQNQAHAWVEARGGWTDGGGADQLGDWITYDPTSGRGELVQRSTTVMTRVRNAFEFLEHTWATSVIAYDHASRDNLVQTIDTRLTRAAISSTAKMQNFPGFLRAENWEISIGLLTVLMTLAIIALVGSIGWFLFERWRMWRRAARIGLESLPSNQRLHLARQLGFYDDLLTLLERRGIYRPMHFTPMEFTDSLSFLPADVYHSIRRLTEVFYRIRYGQQELSTGQRTRLEGIIASVEQNLGDAPAPVGRVEIAADQSIMKAIILSVGDELVLGQTVDTNSAWISQQLAAVGCDINAHMTVSDDQHAIEQAILESVGRCDVLLISGGIGPTEDDLTRQALAAVMKAPLELNQAWLQTLQGFFTKLGRTMPASNTIQAMIPRGATMIDNANGTAAGIDATFVSGDQKTICRVFVMPGVPKEMTGMCTRDVLPWIAGEARGAVILSRTLHTFGLGESTVAERLGELMNRTRNPSVGTTVSQGIVSLRLNARFGSKEEAARELDETDTACRAAVGDVVFGADGEMLADVVAKELLARGNTVATAESCTGGLLAKMLTDISGSSSYFSNGWVTYSNEAKTERLGVSRNLINLYGAVSEQVVEAMATGARRLAKSNYALAISGVAGPTGGTAAKPVGMVCIGLAFANPDRSADDPAATKTVCRTFQFIGDREMVRDRAAKMALAMLRYQLMGKAMPF